MKYLLFVVLVFSASLAAFAQNEQTPIAEKEFEYRNWSFKKVDGGGEVELRKFAAGKKLVLVVYFAPWCHNWRYEAPIVQRLYDKFRNDGFEVIGVGEYDTVEAIRADVSAKKLSFPVVYESDSLGARLTTTHYGFRSKIGDNRKWGSPFNVFLVPENIAKDGDVLVKKLHVSAGELIESDAESFIRGRLGLSKSEKVSENASKSVGICDPTVTNLKKP